MESINSESRPARQLSEISVMRTKTCTVCAYRSPVEIKEPYLLVPVRQSVSAMLEAFSADEVLDGENAYECPQCVTKQKAVQRSVLVSAPGMLVLVVRRFEPSPLQQGTYVRSKQKIMYLSPVKARVRDSVGVEVAVRYETLAVIHHEGNTDRGHYLAHINKQGRWFRCNDRAVTPSVTSNIGSEASYVIFCKKVAM